MSFVINIKKNSFKRVEEIEELLQGMHLFDRIYSKAVVYIEKNCQDSDCPIIDVLYLSSATANFVIRNPHPEQYFKMLTDAIRQNADEKMLPVIIYIAKYLVAFKLQNHGEDNRTLSEIKNFLHEKTINDKWLYDLCDPPDFENYHNYDFHDFDGCITVEENVVPLVEWNVQPELKVPLNQAHLLLDTLKAKDKFGNDMIREDDFKKVVGLFDNFIINGVVPELEGKLIKTGWDAQSIKEVFYDIYKIYPWKNICNDNNGKQFVKFMHHVFAAFDGKEENITYRKFAYKRPAKEQSLASH